MKQIAGLLALLVIFVCTSAARANGTPKRSPGLQVLDRFVGTWDMQAITETAEGKKTVHEYVSMRSWSIGGKFLRTEEPNLSHPELTEYHLLFTYDPNARNYPGIFMRASQSGVSEMDGKDKSLDSPTKHGLNYHGTKTPDTVWDRAEAMQPHCGFGELGICCRICFMGPCRIDPFQEGAQTGVCGATAEVIAARNFARMIAAGAAAHSDHGRDVARALLLAAEHPESGYGIKDIPKLIKVAGDFLTRLPPDSRRVTGSLQGWIRRTALAPMTGRVRLARRARMASSASFSMW